jgi:hypothetical protein
MLPEAGFNFVLGTIQTINASRESKLPMIIFWNLANEAIESVFGFGISTWSRIMTVINMT